MTDPVDTVGRQNSIARKLAEQIGLSPLLHETTGFGDQHFVNQLGMVDLIGAVNEQAVEGEIAIPCHLVRERERIEPLPRRVPPR